MNEARIGRAPRKSRKTKAASAAQAQVLTDIPNIGASIAEDLRGIGIGEPRHLIGRDPYELYRRLNRLTGVTHDPCVADTFIAAVRFMEGGPPRPWWDFTAERKAAFAAAKPGGSKKPKA